jgi:hypothetical protein
MSWKAEDIRTLYASIPTGAPVLIVGSTGVPLNKRRYILQIEAQNRFAGPNTLTLNKLEGVTTTVLDIFTFTLVNDYIPKPDGVITEDALPIYIIEASTVAIASILRGGCSAAGTVDFTVRYVDAD